MHVTIALCLINVIACFHGDVQLVNDNNVNNIVEFCYKGKWRRICVSPGWDNVEANIVCSQLGYSDQGDTIDSPTDFLKSIDIVTIVALCRYYNQQC